MITVKTLFVLLMMGGVLLVAPTGCSKVESTDLVVQKPTRTLVGSSLIGSYSPAQLRSRYTGISAIFQVLIRYGVKAYRIEYNTINTDGTPIRASGALLVPSDAPGALPMLSWQHGTINSNSDASSYYGSGSEANQVGTVFASQGYILVAPDYVGYGASKDVPHPYEHRASLATASLDMLRAAREFLIDQNVNWNERLFLAGYSEGGYATLALQKKIEEETGDEFKLVASSCGAGAYDKTAFMREIINNQTSGVASINRLYIWVLQTYNRIYGLNRPMAYYFKEPYATQIGGSGTSANINVSLNQAFTESFKQGINDGTDRAFIDAVADNNVYDWKPRTPTRLYHGDADNTVFYLNSVNASEAMQKRGATNVTLVPVRGANHATALLTFVTGTYDFFSRAQ